jgi:hypothetical protein
VSKDEVDNDAQSIYWELRKNGASSTVAWLVEDTLTSSTPGTLKQKNGLITPEWPYI